MTYELMESQNVMNTTDDATIERRIRINRPDDENARCEVSKASDRHKDLSLHVQRRVTSARTHRAFRASALQTWREVAAAA
jgi:hypothetical protein